MDWSRFVTVIYMFGIVRKCRTFWFTCQDVLDIYQYTNNASALSEAPHEPIMCNTNSVFSKSIPQAAAPPSSSIWLKHVLPPLLPTNNDYMSGELVRKMLSGLVSWDVFDPRRTKEPALKKMIGSPKTYKPNNPLCFHCDM